MDLSQVKHLYIGDKVGTTEYIDFIRWDEVTESVMKGVDCFGRPFLVVKFLVNGDTDKPLELMQTFFRRYSEYSSKWMGCGHATRLLFGVNRITEQQAKFIEKIINGETLKTTKEITYEFPEGTTVELYNEKKIKAAIVIQKYWRKCRYDPKYKMCEKVQIGNHNEIINDIES